MYRALHIDKAVDKRDDYDYLQHAYGKYLCQQMRRIASLKGLITKGILRKDIEQSNHVQDRVDELWHVIIKALSKHQNYVEDLFASMTIPPRLPVNVASYVLACRMHTHYAKL